jgi:hypothetical protein
LEIAEFLKEKGYTLNIVNVGCMHWNYEPVTLDEILAKEELQARSSCETAEQKRAAWNFAQGMIEVDCLKTSDEMNALIEREIAGEITTADIKDALDQKYSKKN